MSTITTVIRTFSNLINRRTQTASEIAIAGDTTMEELSENILPDIRDVVDEMNVVAGEIADAKTSIDSSEAVVLAISNFAGNWDDLTGSLGFPASVYHDGNFWQLLNLDGLTNITTSEPATTNSDWAMIPNTPEISVRTGQSTIVWGFINELQNSNTYTLPAANSVAANAYVDVMVAYKYAAQTPTVTTLGSDTLSDENGADADDSFIFDGFGGGMVRFISNGTSDWRI